MKPIDNGNNKNNPNQICGWFCTCSCVCNCYCYRTDSINLGWKEAIGEDADINWLTEWQRMYV
jgi:hypothetical protein